MGRRPKYAVPGFFPAVEPRKPRVQRKPPKARTPLPPKPRKQTRNVAALPTSMPDGMTVLALIPAPPRDPLARAVAAAAEDAAVFEQFADIHMRNLEYALRRDNSLPMFVRTQREHFAFKVIEARHVTSMAQMRIQALLSKYGQPPLDIK